MLGARQTYWSARLWVTQGLEAQGADEGRRPPTRSSREFVWLVLVLESQRHRYALPLVRERTQFGQIDMLETHALI